MNQGVTPLNHKAPRAALPRCAHASVTNIIILVSIESPHYVFRGRHAHGRVRLPELRPAQVRACFTRVIRLAQGRDVERLRPFVQAAHVSIDVERQRGATAACATAV